VPDWTRGSAYPAPNGEERSIPLGGFESFDCSNTGLPGLGTKRDPTEGGDNDLPPCFEQAPLLYDNRVFPLLSRGEVSRKRPPTYSLSGRYPANPLTHP
jgi:hypothetical protein